MSMEPFVAFSRLDVPADKLTFENDSDFMETGVIKFIQAKKKRSKLKFANDFTVITKAQVMPSAQVDILANAADGAIHQLGIDRSFMVGT